jgi:hypothetical protein
MNDGSDTNASVNVSNSRVPLVNCLLFPPLLLFIDLNVKNSKQFTNGTRQTFLSDGTSNEMNTLQSNGSHNHAHHASASASM